MAVVSMSKMGAMGRFGNELFQYASLFAYAQEHDCEFQCPAWVGEYLFDLPARPVTEKLPVFREARLNGEPLGYQLPPEGNEAVGHDFVGYCQWHTSWWTDERRVVWDLFQEEHQQVRLLPALEFLHGDNTRIGLHIRRGDYGQGLPWDALTPVKGYLDWLAEWWPKLEQPVLFIASEDRSLVAEFAAYDPQTVESLGVVLSTEPYPHYPYLKEDVASGDAHKIDFWPEWECLSRCHYLVCANSTYSFTAAMCDPWLKAFLRYDPAQAAIVQDDVWNTWPLLRAK